MIFNIVALAAVLVYAYSAVNTFDNRYRATSTVIQAIWSGGCEQGCLTGASQRISSCLSNGCTEGHCRCEVCYCEFLHSSVRPCDIVSRFFEITMADFNSIISSVRDTFWSTYEYVYTQIVNHTTPAVTETSAQISSPSYPISHDPLSAALSVPQLPTVESMVAQMNETSLLSSKCPKCIEKQIPCLHECPKRPDDMSDKRLQYNPIRD